MDDELMRVGVALQPFVHLQLVMVFGSVVSGRARPDSDIDIAVQSAKMLDASTLLQMMDAVAVAVGRTVDMVDLRCAGEPLLGEILRSGKRVFGSSAVVGDLMFRHAVNAEDFVPLQNRMLNERIGAWTKQS